MVWRLSRVLRQRLLWRVRRKLILSYFFIGVVPAALIFLFFLIVSALTLLSFSSYLVKEKLGDLQAQGPGVCRHDGRRTAADAHPRMKCATC